MTENIENFAAIKADMQQVYERQWAVWDAQRSRSLYEKPWLDRFIKSVKPGGSLLELGCGTGDPVARYFMDQGFEITGIDYSHAMIAQAKARFAEGTWTVQDICELNIDGTFSGIYSWDGFFHLSVAEQRLALPVYAKLIEQGGAMLLTVGPEEGEVTGIVGEEAVYHASLSSGEYRKILADNGFAQIDFVAEDPNCRGRSVLLAYDKR